MVCDDMLGTRKREAAVFLQPRASWRLMYVKGLEEVGLSYQPTYQNDGFSRIEAFAFEKQCELVSGRAPRTDRRSIMGSSESVMKNWAEPIAQVQNVTHIPV